MPELSVSLNEELKPKVNLNHKSNSVEATCNLIKKGKLDDQIKGATFALKELGASEKLTPEILKKELLRTVLAFRQQVINTAPDIKMEEPTYTYNFSGGNEV